MDLGLSMYDKVKIISMLAKSEISSFSTIQEANLLANEILPRVD